MFVSVVCFTSCLRIRIENDNNNLIGLAKKKIKKKLWNQQIDADARKATRVMVYVLSYDCGALLLALVSINRVTTTHFFFASSTEYVFHVFFNLSFSISLPLPSLHIFSFLFLLINVAVRLDGNLNISANF